MSKITSPSIPGGFPEYLPEQQLEFDRIKSIIVGTYTLHGFTHIEPAGIERLDMLLAKGGGETDKQVYRIEDKPLGLPFDHTMPLARYAAQHESDLVFPFKRYQDTKVHRGERNQAGRFHEFYQLDIDTIGTTSPLADAEIPAVINEIFTRLDFGPFLIRINDRRILNGFFNIIGIAETKKPELLHALDKIEKMPEPEFVAMLRDLDLEFDQIDKILEFTSISGTDEEVIAALSAYGDTDPSFAEGLSSLRTVAATAHALGVPASNLRIDTRITRGLDYYTGTVYETFLVDHPELGSICSGGRFDNLAENYTKTELPGVGISIGLTRLFYALQQIGIVSATKKSLADIVVLPMSDADFAYAAEVASAIRATGTGAMLYTESDKFKKKMGYADRMGFRQAIIVGETERTARTISIKDMTTGTSRTVPLVDIEQVLV